MSLKHLTCNTGSLVQGEVSVPHLQLRQVCSRRARFIRRWNKSDCLYLRGNIFQPHHLAASQTNSTRSCLSVRTWDTCLIVDIWLSVTLWWSFKDMVTSVYRCETMNSPLLHDKLRQLRNTSEKKLKYTWSRSRANQQGAQPEFIVVSSCGHFHFRSLTFGYLVNAYGRLQRACKVDTTSNQDNGNASVW